MEQHQTNLELRTDIHTRRQLDIPLGLGERPEGIFLERFIAEDIWDQSGTIRIREQKGKERDEIKITADIPLTRQGWREILGVRFTATTQETAESLRSLRQLILEEPHLKYKRRVSAYETSEGIAYHNENLEVQRNGAEANFYENPYYIQDRAAWVSLVRDNRALLTSQENVELEIENEARVYIEPIGFDTEKPMNIITDTYALDGRFRLREKNGEMRYSIKVPLFGKDTERTKACIRIEWKPEEQGILREIRDRVKRLEGTRILHKQGQKLIGSNGESIWVNRNNEGKYWIEFDTTEEIPQLPAEVTPISYQKSELVLAK